MKTKRVLIVSHSYITPINQQKWKALAKEFPEVILLILSPQKWTSTLFKKIDAKNSNNKDFKNLKFITLKTFKTGNETLYGYYPIELFNLLKNFKPEIIQVEQGDNAFSYFQCIIFSKILRLRPKFIFFTWVNWKVKKSLKYKILWNWIEKLNLKNSSGALVGNSDAAKILSEKGFYKPTYVLPQLGVDTDIFYPSKKDSLCFSIGFVGRLVKEKGIFLLLDAFAEIHEKYPTWTLIYQGDGPCKEKLLSCILQKKLLSKIKIFPSVPHEQVAKVIQNLDIFVLPSFDTPEWREQFGHVLIEAMACKIPVIGSDAGEIPKIIKNSGLIFKQKDVSCLRDTLNKLIKNKKLRFYLGNKGFYQIKQHYSHQAIARKTYAFWKSITK